MSEDATPSTALMIADAGAAVGNRVLDADRLITRWQEGRSVETLKAYAGDLWTFTLWLNQRLDREHAAMATGDAITWLLDRHLGEANEIAREYRSHMLDAGMAPATINRRLAALRSLVSLARQFAFVAWELSISNVGAQSYRDTRGPTPDEVRRLMEHVMAHSNQAKAARDVAFIMLMFGNGLRRGEVEKLDISDLDDRGSRLQIMGKGRREAEWVTLATPTAKAVRNWVSYRGREAGPLFCRFNRHEQMLGRLSSDGMHTLMAEWGELLGFTLRPHGIRHSALTAALDATNGNIRAARKFSRHRSVEVLLKYDDNREDLAGSVAKQVAQHVADLVEKMLPAE